MKNTWKIGMIVVLALAFLVPARMAKATIIIDPTNCPGTWETDPRTGISTCTLTSDVYEPLAFVIDKTILDCAGFSVTISGIGGLGAISASGVNGVGVKNCVISNTSGSGIRFDNVAIPQFSMENNTFNAISEIPIFITGSSGGLIANNTISENLSATGVALAVINSDGNTVQGNTIKGGYTHGIFIDGGSDNNQILSNNVSSMTSVGAEVRNGVGNVIDGNTLKDNAHYGLLLSSEALNSVVRNNTLCFNGLADYFTYEGATLNPEADHTGNICDIITDNAGTGLSCESSCILGAIEQIKLDCLNGDISEGACWYEVKLNGDIVFSIDDGLLMDQITIPAAEAVKIEFMDIGPVETLMGGMSETDQIDFAMIHIDLVAYSIETEVETEEPCEGCAPGWMTCSSNGVETCVDNPNSCPNSCAEGSYTFSHDICSEDGCPVGTIYCGVSPVDSGPCPAGWALCSSFGVETCVDDTAHCPNQCGQDQYVCSWIDCAAPGNCFIGRSCGASPEDPNTNCGQCPPGWTPCFSYGSGQPSCVEDISDCPNSCAAGEYARPYLICDEDGCLAGGTMGCGPSPEDIGPCPEGWARCFSFGVETCVEDPAHCPNLCGQGQSVCTWVNCTGQAPCSIGRNCGASPEDPNTICGQCPPGWIPCFSYGSGQPSCVEDYSKCPNGCSPGNFRCSNPICNENGCFPQADICMDNADCQQCNLFSFTLFSVERAPFSDNETCSFKASVQGSMKADGSSKTFMVSLGTNALIIDASIDGTTTTISISENYIERDLLASMVKVPLDRIAIDTDVDSTSISMDSSQYLYEPLLTSGTNVSAKFDETLLAASISVGELQQILNSFINNRNDVDAYHVIADPNAQVDHVIVTISGVDYLFTGDSVVEMLLAIEDLLNPTAPLDVRCGVRGAEHRACGENTEVTLHEKACAVLWNNEPADVVANCPAVAFDNTRDSFDEKFAYYMLTAPWGEYFLIATDPDLLDPMGLPVQSSHPSVTIPDDTFANLIMHIKPDGKKQGMKSGKKQGSVLWVYEPTDVVWVNDIEYYPFFFESDSNWTVDVCLEVPEGYVIIEGEDCLQTFVANEERTILFKVQEVGSVPYGFKSKMKFINPEGKMVVEKNFIGVRLHPHLSLEKAAELLENGYTVDPKSGKIKKE